MAKLQAVDLPPAQEVATQLQAASGRLNEVNATLSGLVDQGDADAIAAIGEVRAQADALRKDIATLDEGVNQLAGRSTAPPSLRRSSRSCRLAQRSWTRASPPSWARCPTGPRPSATRWHRR
ncbi:MAG: hypothetical protein IPI82_09525 [Candidatus Microthrix sp.]|nr:hypothetical protein [Candidatus Microthrix sp.]